MSDQTNPPGSRPDHVLAGELEALPLQVRLAAAVCACGDLEAEHNLNTAGTARTVYSHLACGCQRFRHAVDRYAVSTYVSVPVGQPAPALRLTVRDISAEPTAWRARFGECDGGLSCGITRGETACPAWHA